MRRLLSWFIPLVGLVSASSERLVAQELELRVGTGRTTLNGTRFEAPGLDMDRRSAGLGVRWETFSFIDVLAGIGLATERMPQLRMTVVEIPLLLRTKTPGLRWMAGLVLGIPAGCRFDESGTEYSCETVAIPRGRTEIEAAPDLSLTAGLGAWLPVSTTFRVHVQARGIHALNASVTEHCAGRCIVLGRNSISGTSLDDSYRRTSVGITVGIVWDRSARARGP